MNGFNIIGVTETEITNSNPVNCCPKIPGYEFEYVSMPLSFGGVRMFIDEQSLNDTFQTVNTVKPPLTDTSQQWPLFYFPADGPCILFYFNLSTMATSPQQLQPLKSLPTAKITS